jgi:PAS domain S-box-containing protein
MSARSFRVSPEFVVDPGLLAQIVEVSADAIFSEDTAGKITSWNAAAERLYGRAAEEMLGRSTAELLPAETAKQLRSVHDLALSGERVERFDTRHLRPDGRHVAVSLTVSPLRTEAGAIAGLATSVKDISERVQLTEELAEVHSRLERQFAALGRSNRDLEQFAYVASHDLSEPLRAITGFVQLLEQRYSENLDERGSRYLRHIVDGAARMRTLIEDLLEYSRFLSADQTSVVVETTATGLRVAASFPDADIDVETLPEVWCDEASVYAVLQNLVSNALKFHRPDEPAHVVVSGSQDGAVVQLCVDDDGIGIEPQYRKRVFGMFSRLHVREAYDGTGIGLAIVQQIAERRDGDAWVESSPLGGSRFCITLPAAPIHQEAA